MKVLEFILYAAVNSKNKDKVIQIIESMDSTVQVCSQQWQVIAVDRVDEYDQEDRKYIFRIHCSGHNWYFLLEKREFSFLRFLEGDRK